MLGDLRDRVIGINDNFIADLCVREVCNGHARFQVDRRLNPGQDDGVDLLASPDQCDLDILRIACPDVVNANAEKVVVLPGREDIPCGIEGRQRQVGTVQEVVSQLDLLNLDQGLANRLQHQVHRRVAMEGLDPL